MAEERNKLVRCVEWILAIFVLTLAFYAGDRFERWRIGPIEASTDTVYKTVPVYKDFPDPVKTAFAGFIPVPKYLFFSDTTEIQVPVPVPGDTVTQYVYLPKEQKYYEEEDGKLRMWISGYQPVLDRYEVDWTTTVITNTVVQKQRRWGLGLAVGYGVTLHDGKVSTGPTLSVVVSYNFLTW